MSTDSNETDPVALKEKYRNLLFKVATMRQTYPQKCASLLSMAVRNDADMKMRAEIVPYEKLKDTYLPQYTDTAKMERLGLPYQPEPFLNEGTEISRQIQDIREVLNQIRAARHKNVLE